MIDDQGGNEASQSDATKGSETDGAFPAWPAIPITLACIVLAIVHAMDGRYVDVITLGLLVVAIIPWLRQYISGIKVGDVELSLQKIQRQVKETTSEVAKNRALLEEQRQLIDQVVKSSLSEFLFFHLRELYRRQVRGDQARFDFKCDDGNPMKRDFRMLMDLNYLEYFDVDSLRNGQDISHVVRLTENGRIYVKLREPSISNWKPPNS